jgi:alpha-mannosidase
MDQAYEEAYEVIAFLRTHLDYDIPDMLSSIAENDSNRQEKADIIVFNPLSWEVTNWVEVDLSFEKGQIQRIKGLRCNSDIIDVEILERSKYSDDSLRTMRIGFVATVPPLGYRTYRLVEEKPERESPLKIRGNTIYNKFFRVDFSPDNGLIEVIMDRQKICTGNELVIEEESGDLYNHKETIGIAIKTENGEGVKYGSFRIRNFSIVKSDLRIVINVETDYYSLRWPYRLTDKLPPLIWRHRFLTARKKIIIYRDLPRIDFRTEIENSHPGIRLRVRFLTDIDAPRYTAETQFGAISRQANEYYMKDKRWEEEPSGVAPCLKWFDYSDGDKGLTVINRGTPEAEVRDGSMYMTLLRVVRMLSTDGKAGPVIPVRDAEKPVKENYRYSIYPHRGDWKKAHSYRQAYEANFDLIALQLPRNRKYRMIRSFLQLQPHNVIVTAVKIADHNHDVVVRMYEAAGEATDVTVNFFKAPKKVEMVNLIEERDKEFARPVSLRGRKARFKIKPFEIVTLRVRF